MVKHQVDELSTGGFFIKAIIHESLDGDPKLSLIGLDVYQMSIQYINPASDSTTDAMLDISYLHRPPYSGKSPVSSRTALFPLFTLKQEVVWGLKDPKEGKTNEQTAGELITDFIDFLEQQEKEQDKT